MAPRTLSGHARATVSASQVFDLPELLENILLRPEISNIDIFVAQRVSKAFNNTILGSQKLQRKMYDSSGYRIDEEISKDMWTLLNRQFEIGRFKYFWPSMNTRSAGLTTMDFWIHPARKTAPDPPIVKQMGWQGKEKVHVGGSWTAIEMGVRADQVKIRFYAGGRTPTTLPKASGKLFSIQTGSKFGELFAALNEARSRLRPGMMW